MAATDAKAIPIKNQAYRVTFPILDADGDLVTGAAALDSEVSIDGGTFADATSEATEIATSSGMYFLDLTAAEMNGDTIAIIVKTTTTGAKTTPIVLYTAARSINDLAYPTTSGRSLDVTATGEAGIDWANIGAPTTTVALSGTTVGTATALGAGAVSAAAIADAAIDRAAFAVDTGLQTARSNTAQAGAAGSITLDAAASATTDFHKGAWVYLTGGTGVGQWRLCTAYNGTTKVATVAPNWATNPDATTTFAIVPSAGVDVQLWSTAVVNALISGRVDANVQAMASAVIAAATFAAGAIDAAAIATGAVDADAIADNAIDAGAIAAGAITATKFAAGAIDAAAIAADAIGASEFAQAAADKVFNSSGATLAELSQAAPAATPRPDQALMLLYMALRNAQTTTSSSTTISNDAGTVIAKAALTDDGTTFTKAELATGP